MGHSLLLLLDHEQGARAAVEQWGIEPVPMASQVAALLIKPQSPKALC